MKLKIRNLVYMSVFLVMGFILPYVSAHSFGVQGTVFLPMHIPVFLCGLVLGPLYGLGLGMILPILLSLLTSMPTIYPMAPIMTAELMTYGLFSGLLYYNTILSGKKWGIYVALIISMLLGRISYGLVFEILFFAAGELKALSVWGAIITGIPGIIVQLLIIPPCVLLLNKILKNK